MVAVRLACEGRGRDQQDRTCAEDPFHCVSFLRVCQSGEDRAWPCFNCPQSAPQIRVSQTTLAHPCVPVRVVFESVVKHIQILEVLLFQPSFRMIKARDICGEAQRRANAGTGRSRATARRATASRSASIHVSNVTHSAQTLGGAPRVRDILRPRSFLACETRRRPDRTASGDVAEWSKALPC